jgi:hypothetical protein
MGRGAGNLKTETVIPLLKEFNENSYNLQSILEIVDNYFNIRFEKSTWGKTIIMQLCGELNIHPHYGSYLEDIGLLTFSEVSDLLKSISDSKKSVFDRQLIGSLYVDYLNSPSERKTPGLDFSQKPVLLVAPGASSIVFFSLNEIITLKKRYTIIRINHYSDYHFDYLFLTKYKRLLEIAINDYTKVIMTENLNYEDGSLLIQRRLLINKFNGVEDNAGLMAIKMLILLKAKEINLVGFDGYIEAYSGQSSYTTGVMNPILSLRRAKEINTGMREAIKSYSSVAKINFLTDSIYSS